jgi:predicted Zn-ribbon and HTH transcriptional regulator
LVTRKRNQFRKVRANFCRISQRNEGDDKVLEMQWVACPICNSKTRIKIRRDTIMENFPLFCPKCKQEKIINVQNLQVTIIKEPDAQTQSR